MAENIKFSSESLVIEGLLEKKPGDKAAVVTHPHSLYGGDMYNPVVETVARIYQKKGYTTLRFNFRGVGNSQGRYDDGMGEQTDVRAALTFLSAMGIQQIDLAGYSFGAWVNAHVDQTTSPYARMVMVSPPVGFMGFEKVSALKGLTLVVAGSQDDIAPPDLIRQQLPAWNQQARFEVVEGADHFYSGYLNALETVLESAL
ncbi:alpha/beta hydrolase [Thermodesulfobacteriota bacterium]